MAYKKINDGGVVELCYKSVTLQKSDHKEYLDIPNGSYKDVVTYVTHDIEVTLYGNNKDYLYATWEQDGYYYLIFGYLNDYFDDYRVTVDKFIEIDRTNKD